MSNQITTAFVKQFTDGITLLQQQMGSNLRRGVSVTSGITGDRAFFDQVDATSMSAIGSRHGDTTYTDTPHKRRMVILAAFDVADLVDRPDMVRTLNDPTNSYVRSFASAAGRQIDDTILDAFDGTASTGVDGSGSDTFDTTDFQIAAGGAGMTLAKLREAREKLESAENVEDGMDHEWFIVINAKGRQDLLGDTTLTSADFNTVRALVNGQIDQFMGFTFLKSQRLPLSGSDHIGFAWVKSSMKLAIGQEPKGFIDVLPGKRHSTQVRYEMDIGAVRMDQKGVVQVIYNP